MPKADPITRKKRRPRNATTDSTCFEATGDSTSPKDVLALGRLIVRQLEGPDRPDILTRWMAHYVAELIQQADQASGPDSGVAMERARVAIMDLWSHRWQIQRIDPLADQRQALNVLSSLSTGIDPWRHNPGVEQRMMSRAFQALRVMVVGAALLLQEEPTREIEAAEVPFLDNNETETLKMLAAWRSLFELDVAPASRMRSVVFGSFDSADGTSENQGAPEPEEAGSEKGNSQTPAQQSRVTILRSLERSSAILAEVIEHHQRIIKDGVEDILDPTDKI